MNIWVEYWKFEDTRNNNHAQMKEQAHWVEPNPENIMRRFLIKEKMHLILHNVCKRMVTGLE